MQSAEYLNARRDWKQVSVENNAVAAKRSARRLISTQAAVASADGGGDLRTQGISGGN